MSVVQAPARPTKAELAAAYGKAIPDVIGPGLKVLFCGINPSLYSAAVGYHFARPGNRFWPALHAAGFTERRLLPSEQAELLCAGFGITNLVARATAAAEELSDEELQRGARVLGRKVKRYRPALVAFLGVTAYRTALRRPRAVMGRQAAQIAETAIWVLPNPSGLNAHYRLADLARLFEEMRLAVGCTIARSAQDPAVSAARC
jgi:TDG/mug DNA glycosylase family protein